MKSILWGAAVGAGFGLSLFMAACGGAGTTPPPPVQKTTPTVTVTPSASSITTAQPLTVTVAVSGSSATPTGSVTLTSGSYTSAAATLSNGGATINVAAGALAVGSDTLTVAYTPDTASAATYNNASGTGSVTVSAAAKIAPTVTVTPSPSSISTGQPLTVTVAVSAPSGDATPTGSVTLTSGSYTSTAATLSSGGATINVAAGSLAVGSDTLTVTYTPDTASSATYNSASGTSSVTVAQAYVLTVNSTNPASGVTIQWTWSYNGIGNTVVNSSATSFTVTGVAGTIYTLTAPATAGGNNFSFWTGCTSASTVTCNATLNGNTTVTANFAAPKITPTVTVTPSASSIAVAQALSVPVSVSGGSGNPTPTGSVTLTSGTYTSTAATLSGGSATINIPASSLAVGSDTLTVTYTPDSASSATYNSASGTAPVTVLQAYGLTIDSSAPTSGVAISAIPSDINGNGFGQTPFTLTYAAGTSVSLSAPATSAGFAFLSWTGCTTASGENCTVTMNGNTTVTANYNQPSITSITVSPSAATIGTQQQFTATVKGTGAYSSAVAWTVSCSSCGSLSAGTIGTSGLYTTPYPAPATVTITATSTMTGFTTVKGSTTVTLSPPAATAGPALTVNVGNQTHAISPYIYGWNNYTLEAAAAKSANITVDRFGGDATSRYNYLLDVTSSASDWWFENQVGNTGQEATSQFNEQVMSDASSGAKTLGTVNVLGWVAKDGTSCSFPRATYPSQYAFSPDRGNDCGDGETTSQTNITGNSPTVTSIAEGPSFAGNWVAYLVGKFGTAANGGVFAYDLDNEPAWWDAVHRDVHPVASTYDEVTNNGIATAEAIKNADPTAAVNGPVIDYWWNYFYSKKDIENGWANGTPCWEPWSNPIDREAHGGVAMIEYYLQQFAAASTTYGARLLDYLDLHTYYAATYEGNSVAFTTAGDTGEQEARVNSTRVFWDPTYTDPNEPQPNYITDSNYTSSCNVPLQAPQLIPMAQGWVAKDYPGTKVAFTEYNWGGQESINGAVAQADILGIFGSYGLDMATLWGPPDPTTQVPGLMAFEIYRNYDGNNSTFGDTALASASTNQGEISVYGAIHTAGTANGTVTVMAINKTYGSLTSTLSLTGLAATVTTAQAYLYSNANLSAIVAQPAVTVTPPASGGTISTMNYTFPAQSITLFVIPQ